MKKLFIALTDYQLINFINLKLTMFKEEHVDLIINNNKASKYVLAERLEQLEIFDNIFLYTKPQSHFRQYIKNIINRDGYHNNFNETMLRSLNKDISFYCKKILMFLKREFLINASIWKDRCIDFSEYDHVIGIKTEKVVSDCVELVKRSNNGKCRFSIIDEGLASYLNLYIENDEDVESAFLYNPQMAQYDKKIDIYKIPKINKNDIDLIKKLNYIYNFNIKIPSLKNKIVFFDQAWEPMPKYLKNLTGIKRILLKNVYKKHLYESNRHEFEMKLLELLINASSAELVYIKLHPRSSSTVISEYKQYGCNFLTNLDLPWELFGINCELANGLWVTDNSSALFSYDFTFSSNESNYFLFGFKLYNKNCNEEEFLSRRFLSKYSSFNNNVFIPENKEEFENIVKMLCIEKLRIT